MLLLKFRFLVFFCFLFSCSILTGQIITGKYINKPPSSFCSSSFLISETGNYYFESGCEGTSFINFGHWEVVDSVIRLQESMDLEKYNFISKIEIEKVNSDTTKILIFDLLGENITKSQNLHIKLCKPDTLIYYDFNIFLMEKYGGQKNKSNFIDFIDDEICIINQKVKYIEFPKLTEAFDKQIATRKLKGQIIKIHFSLPKFLLQGNTIKLNKGIFNNKIFTVKEEGLFSEGILVYKRK